MTADFSKYSNGLMPVIIQDDISNKVLMLGFMNKTALEKTEAEGKVTFYSRSKQRLWTKGETSGNFLILKSILVDCDNDTLLIKASPAGPVCHIGADTCFKETNSSFSLEKLEEIISERKDNPSSSSYTSILFSKGINKIAQKVGEEAIELVIESKDNNEEAFLNEAADLLFHFLVLLKSKDQSLNKVIEKLAERHK